MHFTNAENFTLFTNHVSPVPCTVNCTKPLDLMLAVVVRIRLLRDMTLALPEVEIKGVESAVIVIVGLLP